jgi:hypothetical protein
VTSEGIRGKRKAAVLCIIGYSALYLSSRRKDLADYAGSSRGNVQELLPVGGKVGAFHRAGHCPVAAGAGGGIKDAVVAHAAVDGVDGGHELFTTGTVEGVEEVGLVLGLGRELGEHDAAFIVSKRARHTLSSPSAGPSRALATPCNGDF